VSSSRTGAVPKWDPTYTLIQSNFSSDLIPNHACNSSHYILFIKDLASGLAMDEILPKALMPTFTLANNITIPLIGLGSASGVGYREVLEMLDAFSISLLPLR